jgi:Uma2 family endonuclease
MSNAYEAVEFYTYADILEMDENIRAEIIDGELFMMAPPATAHQIISRELLVQLHQFLKGKPCQVFAAPFGVRLFPRADLGDDTFLEPDLVVICDPSKITRAGCEGAPDMVVEILSPSNTRHEMLRKFRKFLAAGVRYITSLAGEEDEIPVSILPGCVIKPGELWPAAS